MEVVTGAQTGAQTGHISSLRQHKLYRTISASKVVRKHGFYLSGFPRRKKFKVEILRDKKPSVFPRSCASAQAKIGPAASGTDSNSGYCSFHPDLGLSELFSDEMSKVSWSEHGSAVTITRPLVHHFTERLFLRRSDGVTERVCQSRRRNERNALRPART